MPIFVTVAIVFNGQLNCTIALYHPQGAVDGQSVSPLTAQTVNYAYVFWFFFFLKWGLTATSEEPPHQVDARSTAHLHSLQTFSINSGSCKNKMNVFIGSFSFPLSSSDV